MSIGRDEALDELYGVLPEEFVLVRARLERELRAAGDTEAAADIKRRRRPHLAAWACNQLAREDPEGIAMLFGSTVELAEAQQATLGGGDADELRAATRKRQGYLDELVDAALRLLAAHAPKPAQYRDNIADTLDAATLDPDAAELLRAGRLPQPLLAPAGFGPLDPVQVPGAPVEKPKAPSKREIEKAKRALDQARRAANERKAAAEEADAAVASADLEAHTAVARLTDVREALQRAQDAVSETGERLIDAQEAAREAHLLARQAEARAQEAEAQLERLRKR